MRPLKGRATWLLWSSAVWLLGCPLDVTPRETAPLLPADPVDVVLTADDGLSPDAGQPLDVAQPDSAEPDSAEPDSAQPDIAEPDIVKPDIVEPDTEFQYPWEPGDTCGMPEYQWLPPGEVGALIDWMELPTYGLKAEVIDALAGEMGYSGLSAQYGTRVFRIRYLTQDRGELKEATGMVGVPVAETGDGPASFPTALFLHPTVGYGDPCAPSQGLIGAASAIIPAAMGYVSVAPDGLGMCGDEDPCGGFHPYLIGEPTAIAGWDGVRAADALLLELWPELELTPSEAVVPWGASQGGHAALFAERYAPHYAPEFDVPCAVALVPPSDLLGQATAAMQDPGAAAGLGTAFLAAATLWYQPPDGASGMFTSAYSQLILDKLPATCDTADLFEGADSVTDVYETAFIDAVAGGDLAKLVPWGCIAAENSLPHTSVPQLGEARILMVLGQNDELVDETVEKAAFQTLCEQGYHLQLIDCADGTHAETAVSTLPLQLEWMAACLADQPSSIGGVECAPAEPILCDSP